MMIVHAAKPLFAWDWLEDSPSLQTIKDLLAALPDGKLLNSLRAARGKERDDYPVHGGAAEGDIVNCPSRLDKTGKVGGQRSLAPSPVTKITCPLACQSGVAPRTKSGFQAQRGGGLENPWVGTERCVPLNASADCLHLALEHRRVDRFHPTLPTRYRTRIEQRLRSAASDRPRPHRPHDCEWLYEQGSCLIWSSSEGIGRTEEVAPLMVRVSRHLQRCSGSPPMV